MSRPELPSPSSHEPAALRGTFLSRRFFEGEDFHRVCGTYNLQPGVTRWWDVGVPLLGDRPVMNDEIIRSGRTSIARANLGIGLSEAGGLMVMLANMHPSRSQTEPITFKPPVAGGGYGGVFAEGADHPRCLTFSVSLEPSGLLKVEAMAANGTNTTFYEGDSARDETYETGLNYCERMIVVPFSGGSPRVPLPVSVTPVH